MGRKGRVEQGKGLDVQRKGDKRREDETGHKGVGAGGRYGREEGRKRMGRGGEEGDQSGEEGGWHVGRRRVDTKG